MPPLPEISRAAWDVPHEGFWVIDEGFLLIDEQKRFI